MNTWGVGLLVVVCSWSAVGQPPARDRLAGTSQAGMPHAGTPQAGMPPDSVAYYRQQGQLYWQTNQPERAVAAFDKCAALNPRENGPLGFILLTQWHEYARAIRYFDAYDALTPNFEDVYANSPVSYLRGLAYQKMGDHDRAIEQMTCGIEPIALKHGAEWVNYRYFINRAVSYLATQQPDRALTDLDKAVKNFDHSALAQYYRGLALVALNRCAEARTAFQDAAFFLQALRVERHSDQEDDYNPIGEAQVDAALARWR